MEDGMTPSELGTAVGRGLVAGLVGTAAMTVSSTIETTLRHCPPDTAPADAMSKLLGLKFKNQQAKLRFSNLFHWGYGTGWGAVRGVLDALDVDDDRAALLHFVALWGSEAVTLPALEVAKPINEQPEADVAMNIFHQAVYIVATSLAYRQLRGVSKSGRRTHRPYANIPRF
jgi:hypothetical protein